ncbi:MAG: four helix bundle protein [Planctomycetaceae bacterium]|nr:four helix bundle protein [Planctomycetaceae bacterium]
MNEAEFKRRTKALALRVVRLVAELPKNATADVIGRQLLRAGTSVGANYRAACRARSTKDMLSKLGIVEEEADEAIYWLELLGDSKIVKASRLSDLIREFNEILAMVVASMRTLRSTNPKSKI